MDLAWSKSWILQALHKEFGDTGWKEAGVNRYRSKDGKIVVQIDADNLLFFYSSSDHVDIFDSLIANKPLPKDKYAVNITKTDGTILKKEIAYGERYMIPENIKGTIEVPVGSAFVMKDGNEQFFPGQCIIGNRDYDIHCSLEKGTDGLQYQYDEMVDGCIVYGYTGTDVDIVIPEVISIDGKTRPVVMIGNEVFNKPAIQSVMIPESITDILMSAFAGSSIQYLSMPHNLKLIETQAFKNCQRLKKINLGKGLFEMGNDVFSGCNNIEDLVSPTFIQSAPNIVLLFNPTPEHPITVYCTNGSKTFTEKPKAPGIELIY